MEQVWKKNLFSEFDRSLADEFEPLSLAVLFNRLSERMFKASDLQAALL